MNGEIGNGEKDDDVTEEVESIDSIGASEDTVVLSEDMPDLDNVGDTTVELEVEKLVAKIESGDGDAEEGEKEVHRRIEAINDRRAAEEELDSTFNFNLDEDL